jgi:hypothetical protein
MVTVAKRRAPSNSRRLTASAWWKSDAKSVAGDLFATCKAIRHQLDRQRAEDAHHQRLYSNMNVDGRGWAADIRMDRRMRYNLVRSSVDTAQSIVAQQRPRPQYITTAGSWKLMRQARLMTQVIEGQLHDCGAYKWGPDVQRDGGVCGTGFVLGYVCPEEGAPKLERLLPMQVIVDHNDGLMGSPRSVYVRWAKPRDALRAAYTGAEKIVDAADGPSSHDRADLSLSLDDTVDQVAVVEAWHLETTKGAGDGRHVIAVSSGVLLDEKYTERRLPVSAYRWATRQAGYYGVGIAEECRDAQWRINRLIAKSEALSDLGSNGHVLAARETKVRVEQITDQPYRVIEYNAGAGLPPPTFVTHDGVPPGIQGEIEQIKAEKFQELGLSQMSTRGEIPAGLNSGKAIRAHEDVSSRRHVINGRMYEAFFMDMVDLLEMLNSQAAEQSGSYQVTARTTRGRATLIQQVNWRSVRLPEHKHRLQMWPTSSLPSTPQGKMAAVQEWVDGGWVSRPFAQALLDFPDIDAAMRIELADLDCIMYDIERILDGEDGVEPDPYMDLALAADVARRSLLQARVLGAPADVLLALREYVDSAMAQSAAAQMATAQAPGQGAPQLPGMAIPPAPQSLPASAGPTA